MVEEALSGIRLILKRAAWMARALYRRRATA
jgi:hypothetical protein